MSIIYLIRGDDLSFDITITRNGNAFPLVPGTDVVFTMKASANDRDSKAIRKSIGYGITVLDAAASKVRITLNPADTAKLPNISHLYPYEVKVVDLTGNVFTVLADFIQLNQSVVEQNF